MFKAKLLNEVLKILNLNGFRTLIFGGCSDVLGKNGRSLLIKVLVNIDGLSKEDAKNMKIVSQFFSAYSLTVSVKSNYGMLSENIIYSRFGIPVMTPHSFETIIKNEWLPSILAIKGKHIVEIDADLLKKEREDMKLSLEILSKKLKVSKKCLYEIENERVRPTEETVEKLEEFFGVQLKKPYELKSISVSETINPQTPLQRKICFKFKEIEIDHSCLTSLPFEIIGRKRKTLITGLSENEEKLESKTKIFNEFSSFANTTSVFITKRSKKENLDGIPIILDSEIDEVDSYRDFSGLIRERK